MWAATPSAGETEQDRAKIGPAGRAAARFCQALLRAMQRKRHHARMLPRGRAIACTLVVFGLAGCGRMGFDALAAGARNGAPVSGTHSADGAGNGDGDDSPADENPGVEPGDGDTGASDAGVEELPPLGAGDPSAADDGSVAAVGDDAGHAAGGDDAGAGAADAGSGYGG